MLHFTVRWRIWRKTRAKKNNKNSSNGTVISSVAAVCRESLLFNVLLLYLLVFIYDSKLPIVLFVGQHFSGSLFECVHLSILTRERTKETRCKSEPRLRKARALR